MQPVFLGPFASIASLCIGGIVQPAVVDFEPLAVGTMYGIPSHDPGDLAFSQNDIDVYVDSLAVNTSSQFFMAEVGGTNAQGFPTKALSIDNISMIFDFSGLPFAVNSASVEYQEFGGVNNFAVNGGAPLQLLTLSGLPSSIAPGISAMVHDGMIMLEADTGFAIASFRIGGQELGIDSITAVPEPATLMLLGAGGLIMIRRTRRA